MPILFIIYLAAGYWAANRTIYANKILFGNWFIQKVMVAMFLGWALIPVAIIKSISRR